MQVVFRVQRRVVILQWIIRIWNEAPLAEDKCRLAVDQAWIRLKACGARSEPSGIFGVVKGVSARPSAGHAIWAVVGKQARWRQERIVVQGSVAFGGTTYLLRYGAIGRRLGERGGGSIGICS